MIPRHSLTTSYLGGYHLHSVGACWCVPGVACVISRHRGKGRNKIMCHTRASDLKHVCTSQSESTRGKTASLRV
jgi:hypothetical protein